MDHKDFVVPKLVREYKDSSILSIDKDSSVPKIQIILYIQNFPLLPPPTCVPIPSRYSPGEDNQYGPVASDVCAEVPLTETPGVRKVTVHVARRCWVQVPDFLEVLFF